MVRVSDRAPMMSSKSSSKCQSVVWTALVMDVLLFFVLLMCWLCQPSCCDYYSLMDFRPQLRYVDGPPPM